ncbi:hypothetical protein J2Z22_000665 [Paenibacillus forsythiae]|uniref:Uncharacterized protein n=1 Tax=Paenibacillus forsythiae TaxID=365616 RepID=A0ABU3H2V8_9BACL|nr:hypothetical protein [Paenibacillus forsythiae]MDT3425152.1 hypothetical protein [Paenibacillus forsythiae]
MQAGRHDAKRTGVSGRYVWSASSQNYLAQNLSVLADPQSRFKLSETGFVVQLAIAYDQFGVEPKEGQDREVSLNNFIVDTRNNQFHLRRVDSMDGKPGFVMTSALL